ncbi:hypothetical protein OAF83_03755 [Rubripirellula sp.]|nr:hypothetical protein [Rubripirellula sp.]MDB4664509.1 hypothetical protein [bacterium]MDB4750000.1 hypothetical protein [Rubripirellula sp.]
MNRVCSGCFLGLSVAFGFVGCSDTPELSEPLDGPTVEANDVNAPLPSGEQIEEAAGDAVDAVADGVTAAWAKASSAMNDFEGGREMLGNVQEMFSSAKTSLSDVTSEDSALKAKAELDKLSAKMDEWKPRLSEMSGDAKAGAKRFFDHVADQLSQLGMQLNENEWVNTILKPKLREVIEQLKSLV